MNGINGIGGMSLLYSSSGNRKIDSVETAQQLFSKLDTSAQGYLELSDLQSAFTKVSSISETSNLNTDTYDAEELFSRLDSDSDGKITEQEFTDSLAQLDEQINTLFSQMRMSEASGNMLPPPPPPPEASGDMQDAGFTEEELIAQLDEIGDSDSARSSLIESIIANFDEADTDGDGRVSNHEAMAFDQSDGESTDAATLAATDTDSITSEKALLQLVRLLEAYDVGGSEESNSSSSISISA
jgi:Ca2+-binding EF-hand superfamily protein